jgi:hypothetical protein
MAPRLTARRQSWPKRSWLGPTEPILQRDKVHGLALGALIRISSRQKSQQGHFARQPCAVLKTNVQTNTCGANQVSGRRPLLSCRPN